MSLIQSIVSMVRPAERASSWPLITVDDYAQMLSLGSFPFAVNTTMHQNREEVEANFTGLVQGAYRANGVVFACMAARQLLFSECRFQFQQMRGGRPGDLFGTPDLGIIERPEPGKTTGDLLSRAITDADLAGNWFGVRRPGRIRRLRPDWTYMILGSRENADVLSSDIDAELLGFAYKAGGLYSDSDPEFLDRTEVAHFAPYPDPLAHYRGMSWLTPVIREIMSDSAATLHKLKFFENNATVNLVVKFPPTMGKDKAQEWVELFEQDHKGAYNAYRTVYLGAGADVTVVGSDLKQQDFKAVQGAGETRIAAAARIHPTIVGLSEGLQGSSLNAGNFGAARRLVADGFLRPAWRNFAGSVEVIVPPPPGSRLWYDARDVPFLAEDVKDAAAVLAQEATAIRQLWDGGADPASAIEAVTAGDLRRLRHSGFLSVQMQPARPTGDTETVEEVPEAARSFVRVHAPTQRPSLPALASGPVRSTAEFWPVTGQAEGLHVGAGMVLPPDHYLAAAFPQFFEPATVIENRAALLASGPVDVRCTAQRPDGRACNQLVLKRLAPGGSVEAKCERCGALVTS